MSARGTFITSPVEDISRLWFYPFPARPTKVVKAMRVGRTHVAVGASGRIYSSQAEGPCRWSSVQRMAPTIEALIALGLLTAEAIVQHKAAEADERAQKNQRIAATQVLDAHESCGVKLTESQLKKLRIAAGRDAARSLP